MKLSLCFVILGFINTVSLLSNELMQINYTGENNVVPYKKCLLNIIEKTLSNRNSLTLLNFNNDLNDFLSSVESDLSHSFFIRSSCTCNLEVYAEDYIILAQDVEDLKIGIVCLTQNPYWNPTGRFVIILQKAINKIGLKPFFEILLEKHIFNVIVLSNAKENTPISTYNPFDKDVCCRHTGKIINLGTCDTTVNNTTIENFFPNKAKDGLRNCTIVVGANEDIPMFIYESTRYRRDGKSILGLEQFIIENVAKIENFEVKYNLASSEKDYYGVILQNGTATGQLGNLERGTSDIAAGGFHLMNNRVKKFDFIWGYNYANFELYTHSVVGQRWTHIYREFSRETWILIAISFNLILITSFLVKYIVTKISVKTYERIYLVLLLWGYLFANSSDKLNKIKAYRDFLICWIWFAFFVSSFYSTALYSLITGNRWPTKFKDLDYFISHGYRPCISKSTREFFLFAFNQSLPEGEKRIKCEIIKDSLETIAAELDLYGIEADYDYRLHKYKYIDDEGNKMLEHWPYVNNMLSTMYFNRGSVLVSIFHKYSNYLYEGGLMEKQLRDIAQQNILEYQKKVNVFHEVKLIDLKIPFLILFVGALLSTVVCILEMLLTRSIIKTSEYTDIELRKSHIPEDQEV